MIDARIKTSAPFFLAVGAAVACGCLGPWWSTSAPALLAGFYVRGARRAAASGFAIGAVAWALAALAQDLPTAGRLSARIGGVLQAPLAPLAGYAVTAILGGMIAALAAWVGFCVRDLTWPPPIRVRPRG